MFLQPSDTLLTIAEVAVAVLGFAGIVAALQSRTAPMSELRLFVMVEAGGATIAFALLPLALIAFSIEPQTVWSVCSGLLAAAAIAVLLRTYVRQRRMFGSIILRETIVFDALFWITSLIAAGALTMNALNIGFEASFAVFFAGLLFLLMSAVVTFVRIVYVVVATSNR